MRQWVITGQPAADGIAMGAAVITAVPLDRLDKNHVGGGRIYTFDDFYQAIWKTEEQLRQFQQRIQERIPESVSQIFAAHLMILEDAEFIGQIQKQIEKGMPVPEAINLVADKYIDRFSQSTAAQFREKVDDLEDLTRRLLANLNNQTDLGANNDYEGRILITSRLFPSDILRFVAQNAEGIILTSGGVTAHISILARSLEMPMILADAALLTDIANGTSLLMDAHTGLIYVNPDSEVVCSYVSLLETRDNALPYAGEIEPQTYTRDGRRIRLIAAVGLISEARLAHELRAEGIGLYRSEMPFLIRSDFPSEDEQYAVYRNVMQEMQEGEIVFRTLDVGGDKILRYFPAGEEANPFLGLRGIRFTFRHRNVFSQQIRALLRAGHDRPIKIMFPLVSSIDSFVHARNLVKELAEELESKQIPHQLNPAIGAMIELPCAVSLASELAAEADFLSIGSNDLVQYMLAVDRTNKQVAEWYISWHPAVLRAIKVVIEAARRRGKPVSICGDMAEDTKLIPVLIGMGITSLTIPPRRIPRVQQLIQSIDAAAAEELAQKVLRASMLAEIACLLGITKALPGY
ncbi:Pdp protein [Candidatus Moduliflexus flocculans]|uniref:Phosphoenolpyruvate-protein phosphotransferase n=1 Tax=Candidatus Moduliflexus flocculans TaxID=1499966 RepID=A0A0S6VX85_9BACT|nr:Pdp protein [Candidatus Moduliflexus flocculans]